MGFDLEYYVNTAIMGLVVVIFIPVLILLIPFYIIGREINKIKELKR